jgi:hypothetical protein
LEAREPFGILREDIRQNLEGHIAIELGIPGSIDLAHAAMPDQCGDFVGTETRACVRRA